VTETLADGPIVAFVATVRPTEARAFYEGVLRLRLVHEDQFALEFVVGGISLRVTRVQELQPAGYTVLGWTVPDIHAAVTDLAARGVQFERFPAFMQQDEQGVWAAPGGAQVAWFKDPDGNTLSLTQTV
jgi:catechol 2,3-dioxygenase-like lactoylglutathione lyase family enzyme